MNWATLITELRSATWTNTWNYSDILALIDLNKSYHYIEDCLTQEIWESFLYQEFITDTTVAGQKEYTLPADISWNLDWLNKVLGISIDYGDSTYVKATKIDVNSLDKDVSWYETNQSTSSPIYTIQDNSIMIFPVPTATTIWDIKIYWVQNLIDLTALTDEDDVFNWKIHKKYHPLIVLWAEQYWYVRNKQLDKSQEAEWRFHGKLFWEYVSGKYAPWMMDMLNTRQRGARIRQMPTWFKVNV